ncbi:MAG: YigZ family protein [candidate division KSB1 bacterium]|nr:YigZ family protein [candidate division KSB1 bacterium]MDZ7340280.1 YigZ family protein [candidate division KSB1 bacterium]
MMIDDEYLTIQKVQTAELKVKGSRFIGTASPVATEDAATEFIQRVARQYYAATHHCYAYHIGVPPEVCFRMSDAGEPTGTAGLPILNVIKGKGLTDIVVVVSRYFGGTKLGKGGLARAYADCTLLVLQQSPIIKKYMMQQLQLTFDYQLTNRVMGAISLFQATINQSTYGQEAQLVIALRKSQIDKLKQHLIEVTAGKISIQSNG